MKVRDIIKLVESKDWKLASRRSNKSTKIHLGSMLGCSVASFRERTSGPHPRVSWPEAEVHGPTSGLAVIQSCNTDMKRAAPPFFGVLIHRLIFPHFSAVAIRSSCESTESFRSR